MGIQPIDEPAGSISAIDALIWVLERGCFFQCFFLSFTSEDAQELINDIKNDLPAAKRTAVDILIQQATTRPPEALLAWLKLVRTGTVGIPQGTGAVGGTIKLALGDRMQKKIRQKIAVKSANIMGKAGVKVFGRLGTKLIPGAGLVLLVAEGCNALNCLEACRDGEFTRDETWLGRAGYYNQRTRINGSNGKVCYECHPGREKNDFGSLESLEDFMAGRSPLDE